MPQGTIIYGSVHLPYHDHEESILAEAEIDWEINYSSGLFIDKLETYRRRVYVNERPNSVRIINDMMVHAKMSDCVKVTHERINLERVVGKG